MPITLILFLLLIALPSLEIYLLLRLSAVIGAIPTLLLELTTALLGSYLVRHQGLEVLRRLRRSFNQGQTPAQDLLDGGLLLLGGMLLLLPGLLTDIVGALLLLPPLRRLLARRFARFFPTGAPARAQRSDMPVLEGEYRREPD